jgi:hypothetical protein
MLRRTIDRVLGGRGEFSITVPTMDGPFKPNDYLERARSVARIPEADNLVASAAGLFVSSENRILSLTEVGDSRVHSEHEATVTCLAASAAGALAVGLDGLGIKIVGGRHNGTHLQSLGAAKLNCPTAVLFLDEDTVIVSNGSVQFSASHWRHDFVHRGTSGTVVKWELSTGTVTRLASNLSFPAGLCARTDRPGQVLVSEAWRHRVISVGAQAKGSLQVELGELPGYPGRIYAAPSGGYWLTVFAVRSQLQEFVLRESRFRRQMMKEVDPDYWIAPALSSGHSFKEPLQAGGVIRLGIHKPWAPTRSYGLVIRLDDNLSPMWSAHSRANGKRHGITSAVESNGELLVTSKGKGEVIGINGVSLCEPQDLDLSAGEAA